HWSLLARSRRIENPPDGVYELGPFVPFARQLLSSRCGEPVILRALIGLAHGPLRLHPAPFFEAVQRGVERSGFDLQQIVGLRADRLADAVAVLRTPLQDPQDEHVERS